MSVTLTRDNAIPAVLFALTLAMGVIVVLAWWTSTSEPLGTGSTGPSSPTIPHRKYGSMEEGSIEVGREGSVLGLGCALGLLNLAFFTSCLLLGMRKGSGFGPTTRPLLLAGLGWAVVWAALFWTYFSYRIDPQASRLLGLPAPTAWMLYGAWAYPILFTLYFVFSFHGWFLREEDLQRFQQLVRGQETGPTDRE